MRFPAYPSYRDSGVEWIGPVPADWHVCPLLAVAEECDRSNRGMIEDNLLSLSYGSIVRKDINTSDGLLPESFETYQIIEPNDIVWRLTDLQNDKRSLRTAIVRERGIITSAYLATKPHGVLPTFLSYLLRAYDQEKVFYSMGGGLRQSMKYADVRRMPIVIPSQSEQTAIAAFLDRETAKIDALVEEQRRLIELLKEKRQAVISHAVTKGLDPTVPMKDSGVEWLGDVPAHWAVKPLKHLAAFRSGGTPSKENRDFWDGEVPWASAKDLKRDVLMDTVDHLARAAIEQGAATLVPVGSVLVLVRGMMLARTFPVCKAGVPMTINQDLKALLPALGVDGSYLAWLLRGTATETLNRLDEAGHGTKALRMEAWVSMQLPMPSEDEQGVIVAHLERAVGAIDALCDQATAAISLLQERRAAIIAAAVTGKIDVRGVGLARAEAA